VFELNLFASSGVLSTKIAFVSIHFCGNFSGNKIGLVFIAQIIQVLTNNICTVVLLVF